MKILISFFLSLFCISLVAQQEINSVTDGLFSETSTWDCNCIPSNGDDVYIDHSIILDTSYSWNSGYVLVGSSGLLTDAGGYSLLIDGVGEFRNNGQVTLTSLIIGSGSVNNWMNAQMNVSELLVNDGEFENFGSFQGVDSILNSGSFRNSGDFVGGLFFNDNLFKITWPNSHISLNTFWNSSTMDLITGSIHLSGNLYNEGDLDISVDISLIIGDSVYNSGTFFNEGRVEVYGSFLNGNNGIGTLGVIGSIEVAYDFFNDGSIYGAGRLCVGELSVNSGSLVGIIDFCDHTPTTTTAPYFDINTGTGGGAYSWCVDPCILGLTELREFNLEIYPQPVSDNLIISTENEQIFRIRVMDLSGRIVDIYEQVQNSIISIDFSNTKAGTYFVQIELEDGRSASKPLVVIH